jgi:ABC-type transport system involved in multi-copper enzyme maturation permease subunit
MSATFAWLQKRFARGWGWLAHSLAWDELRGALVLLAGAYCLWWLGSQLSQTGRVVLGAVLLVAIAVVLRRGWVRFFGPVLFYDLVRTARRRQHVLLRSAYALLLLAALFSAYCKFILDEQRSLAAMFAGFSLPKEAMREKMPVLAGSVFQGFLVLQFLAIYLLTPAYVAPAIAEEKEHRGLDYLFATDLLNREIVLSLFVSRLANLLLVLLTGLPVLSLVQLLGGVDPEAVLASFAASFLTVVSLAGWSVLCSVHARRARTAVLFAYLGPLVYLLLSAGLWQWLVEDRYARAEISGMHQAIMTFSSNLSPAPPSPPESLVPTLSTLETAVEQFGSGNPWIVWQVLEWHLKLEAAEFSVLLANALKSYTLVHGLIALLCLTWSVLRLRVVALKHTGLADKPRPQPKELFWTGVRIRRPATIRWPMLWKEVRFGGAPFRWLSRLALYLFFAYIGCLPIAVLAYLIYPEWFAAFSVMPAWAEAAGREVGPLFACLMLLGVAIRAAGSVSGERERGSLDALLLAPQDSNRILFAKLVGSLLSVRRLALLAFAVWLAGYLLGADGNWLALALALVAWCVYALFVACVGLWFSVVCSTSQRALIWTVVAVVTAFGGHWLIWMFFVLVSNWHFGDAKGMEFAVIFQSYGLTPPLVLRALSSSWGENFAVLNTEHSELALIALQAGLSLYGLAAVLFWTLASHRFRQLSGRPLLRWTESGYLAARTTRQELSWNPECGGVPESASLSGPT